MGRSLSGDETEDSVEPGVDDSTPDEQDDAAPAPPQSQTTPGLTRSNTTDFQQVWRFVSSTRIITILSFTLALIVGIAAWVGMNYSNKWAKGSYGVAFYQLCDTDSHVSRQS
jgi:hypothetical protein